MNESQIIKKTANAVYGNKPFSVNFAPYDPEIIPATSEQHQRDIEERYSIFECSMLLKKFDWFRNLKKFTFKKYQVDVSQTDGIGIYLNGEEVGFIEKKEEKRWRIGFCLEDKENEDGFSWGFLPNWFDSSDDAKKYINCYYGKIQDKFTFYKEPIPIKEEIKEETNDDEEW